MKPGRRPGVEHGRPAVVAVEQLGHDHMNILLWSCRRCVGGAGPRPPATESRVARAPSPRGVPPGVPTWGARRSPFRVRSARSSVMARVEIASLANPIMVRRLLCGGSTVLDGWHVWSATVPVLRLGVVRAVEVDVRRCSAERPAGVLCAGPCSG